MTKRKLRQASKAASLAGLGARPLALLPTGPLKAWPVIRAILTALTARPTQKWRKPAYLGKTCRAQTLDVRQISNWPTTTKAGSSDAPFILRIQSKHRRQRPALTRILRYDSPAAGYSAPEPHPARPKEGQPAPQPACVSDGLSLHATMRSVLQRRKRLFAPETYGATLPAWPTPANRARPLSPSNSKRCWASHGPYRADHPSTTSQHGPSPTIGPIPCPSRWPRSMCSTAGSATCSMRYSAPTHDLIPRRTS